MRRLLGFKLNALKFVDSISGTLKETIEEAKGSAVDVSTNFLSININKVEHSGFSVYLKGLALSEECKNDYNKIKGTHNIEATFEEGDAFFNLQFSLLNISAAEFIEKLQPVIQNPMVEMILRGKISAVSEGHDKVNLAFKFPAKFAAAIKEFHDIIKIIQDELKVDQSVEVHLRLATTMKKILEEGGEPLIMQLLEGISIDVKLNLWKKLSDLLMRIVGNCEVDAGFLPILGGIAPLFLLQIGGTLDIKIDEHMKEKIKENPLAEPVLIPAADLITTFAGVSYENDEEYFKDVNEKFPEPLSTVINLFSAHLGTEVDFEVLDEFVGLKGRISGEGLNELVRAAVKFPLGK